MDVLPRTWLLPTTTALVLLFLAVSITPMTNNDIWLHMANGEWILAHGRVPHTDPYSFSAEGNRFHAHEWLAGVVFDRVHLVAGVTGLILFKTLLGGLALAVGAAVAFGLGARPVSVLGCTGLALAIANSRFLERPEMFSYLFTAVYVGVLASEHRQLLRSEGTWSDLRSAGRLVRSSRLWLLVPVQWLWVQLHGYHLTGLAILVLFLVGESLARPLDDLRSSGPPALPAWNLSARLRAVHFRNPLAPRLVSGAAALVAMLVLGLLNPNSWEVYTYPFQLAAGSNVFMRTIFEWKPTFVTSTVVQSSMFLALCLWLAAWLVGCLDSARLLAAVRPWRVACILLLLALVILRIGVLSDWHMGTSTDEPTAWLRSPGELLSIVYADFRVEQLLAPAESLLRLAGPAGDDLFTLLWLLLAAWTLLCWKRPAAAGLPLLAICFCFCLQAAGAAAGPLLLVVLGPAMAYAVVRGSLPVWQAIITAAFLVLAVRQNRNIVNLTVLTLPFLAAALTRTARALPSPPPRTNRRSFALPAARACCLVLGAVFTSLFVLTLTAGWPYTPRMTKKPGLGVGRHVPVEPVEFIKRHGIRGRVFNEYTYGAYLIHELFPDTRVFMDSRADVYGPELYQTYLDVFTTPRTASAVFASNAFDYVLVDYFFHRRRNPDAALHRFLREHPEWPLVYFDDDSLLFLHRSDAHRDLITRFEYRVLDPTLYAPGAATRLSPAQRERYDLESRRAVAENPHSVVARLMRVDLLVATGRLTEADELLTEILRDAPRNHLALTIAARVAGRLGHADRAREYQRQARQLDPAAASPGLER